MSDIHRLKTLDSLEQKGVYVNDYPGLIMDGKDLSYFFLRFTREELLGDDLKSAAKREKGGGAILTKISDLVARHNEAFRIAGTDKELKIFYMDDQGNSLLGRVEDEKETLRIKTGKREIVGERIFQLNLNRLYSAEGLDGLYQVRHSEVKNVYDALQKFIAAYMHGWIGLFRQYETVKERTEIFRRFKPFKFPFFGTKESLKRAVFHIQLGIRSSNGDEDFKRISTSYGEITLEDALSV